MGMRVEWVTAAECSAERVEDGFTDQWGTGIDAGNVGVMVAGVILEGTPEELELLANAIITAAREEP